jgi:TRAP-type uncharacterized transport system substrate-binding protein
MQEHTNGHKLIKPVHLDFISPGPINLVTTKLLNKFHPWITATSRAIPAPDHLHKIHTLPPELKKFTLPIMPNTDFMYALQAGGPPEHKYEREFRDLKFIASKPVTSQGIFTLDQGIQNPEHLEGKRIGVVPKASSHWIWTHAILRDAWNIFDKVTLVTCPTPMHGIEKLISGEMDATMWGLFIYETIEGNGFATRPSLKLLEGKKIHWISLSLEDVEKINRINPWKMGRLLMPKGSIRSEGVSAMDPPQDVGLVDFNVAICAWDSTDDHVVYELLRFLDEKSSLWPEFSGGRPMSLARMSRYPGLTEDMVHPAALKYYKEKGIHIGRELILHRMN